MSEVRMAVERALSKLINRFGPMSDVIKELEFAITELKKQEGGAAAPPPTQQPAAEAEQKAGDTPGSKPTGRSVRRGNK